MTSPGGRRIFYGYWLVAVTFVFLLLFNGCGTFVFSLFVKPLEAELGWNRGEVMAGFTFFYLTMGLASPVVGRFVDRHGARHVMVAGGILMGLGFVIVSQMSHLWLFYAGYFVVGVGAAAMGPVPCSAVVSNWFKRRRGTAVGLMAAGIGAGGLVMAPLVGYLLENFDWRMAYLSMGILCAAVTVPLALGVIKTRPSEMGLYPDGATAPSGQALDAAYDGGELAGFTFQQARRTTAFWLIAVSFMCYTFASMGTLQASAPYVEDLGFPTAVAASALGVLGLGSAIGKIFFGWLCDKVPPNRAFALGLVLLLGGLLILMSVRADSPDALPLAYGLVSGLGAGAWLPCLSILASRTFGLMAYGAIFGALNLAQSVGTSTGPLFAGVMHDATDSYVIAFITFAILICVGIPLILAVRKPSVSDGG